MDKTKIAKQLADSLFNVKLTDSRERQLEEFQRIDEESSKRGLYRQSAGYQQLIKLLKKQIKENCNILIECLIKSIDKESPIYDDVKRTIYLRVVSFIDSEINLKHAKLRQRLAANRFPKGATSSLLAGLNSEIVGLKQYFRNKVNSEIESFKKHQSESHRKTTSQVNQKTEDIVEVKPNFFGIGLNIRAIFRRLKSRFSNEQ